MVYDYAGLKSEAMIRPKSKRTRLSSLYLRRRWLRLSLFRRFAIIATLSFFIGTAMLGHWVSARVGEGVMSKSASAAALYLTNVIEPHLQSLDVKAPLPSNTVDTLQAMIRSPAFNRHVVSLKIWSSEGRVVFSSHADIIGKNYDPKNLHKAFAGQVTAELAPLDELDSEVERSFGKPLYEIFAPLYRAGTNDIIAVAEFYEDAKPLLDEMAMSQKDVWTIIIIIAAVLVLPTLVLIDRESRILFEQRTALKLKRREQIRLHRLNEDLRNRVLDAQMRLAAIDNQAKVQIGAELHDGVAQLLTYVLLRLDALRPGPHRAPIDENALVEVQSLTSEALNEVRMISAGLILPSIVADADLETVIRDLIRQHEARTRTTVALEVEGVFPKIKADALGHLARIVQEGLTNAVKHAAGSGQSVQIRRSDTDLVLEIGDEGDCPLSRDGWTNIGPHGLGLAGIRARAEILGGSCVLEKRPHRGTMLRVSVHLDQVAVAL